MRRRGLQRLADVEHVRERLGPVLGRVHRRVGADVRVRPVLGRPGLVVAVQRRLVVLALVAEQRPHPLAVDREHLEVEVPDLVAHVAEQRAVGLGHLLAHLGPVRVDGLGQVERHEPVGVAGGDRLEAAGEQVEAQLLRDRQAELAELVEQPPLGALGLREGQQRAGVVVRRAGARARAAEAQLARRARAPSCTPPARRWRSARAGPARACAAPTRSPAACRSGRRPGSRTLGAGRSGRRERCASAG